MSRPFDISLTLDNWPCSIARTETTDSGRSRLFPSWKRHALRLCAHPEKTTKGSVSSQGHRPLRSEGRWEMLTTAHKIVIFFCWGWVGQGLFLSWSNALRCVARVAARRIQRESARLAQRASHDAPETERHDSTLQTRTLRLWFPRVVRRVVSFDSVTHMIWLLNKHLQNK